MPFESLSLDTLTSLLVSTLVGVAGFVVVVGLLVGVLYLALLLYKNRNRQKEFGSKRI